MAWYIIEALYCTAIHWRYRPSWGHYCVLVAQGILWNFCSYHDQELCKSFNELNEHKPCVFCSLTCFHYVCTPFLSAAYSVVLTCVCACVTVVLYGLYAMFKWLVNNQLKYAIKCMFVWLQMGGFFPLLPVITFG